MTLNQSRVFRIALILVVALVLPACGKKKRSSGGGSGPSTAATQTTVTTQPPASIAPYQAFPVVVECRNAAGAVDTSYTGAVTLSIATQPAGDLLYHCSGNGTVVHEILNAGTPAVVGPVTTTYTNGEIFAMVYDPNLGLLRTHDISNGFALLDPGTGDMVRYGNTNGSGPDNLHGMRFNGVGQIRAVSPFLTNTYTIDLTSGVQTNLGVSLTLAGFTLTGTTALARHPGTGVFYAIVKTNVPSRRLVTVSMGTGVCTDIGDVGDNVSSLSFSPTGTLYATTGDGATTPETLWTVDLATGALTSLLTLGNGLDGEIIEYFPRRLVGSVTVNAVAGVATFPNVSIDQPGTGYSLTATSAGLTSVTTGTFDVTGTVTPTASVGFSTAASAVAEAAGTATVTVQLSAAQTHNVPVMIFVDTASTASVTADHTQPLAFQVVVPAGQTTVNFTVAIVDDGVAEGNETVILTIGSARLATGIAGNTTHTLTINNDD